MSGPLGCCGSSSRPRSWAQHAAKELRAAAEHYDNNGLDKHRAAMSFAASYLDALTDGPTEGNPA